jgi:hypothetical protein
VRIGKVQGALWVYLVLRVRVKCLDGVAAPEGPGLRAQLLPLQRPTKVIQDPLFRLLTELGAPQLLDHGAACPRGLLPVVLHEGVLLGGVPGGLDCIVVRGL